MDPAAVRSWRDLTSTRNSVRDFRRDPIPEDLLAAVLDDAMTAPSWSNVRPYRLAVASGQVRDRISADLCRRFDVGMRARRGGVRDKLGVLLSRSALPDGDVRVPEQYPPELQPARVATGRGLYRTLGIERHDLTGRDRQMRRNFEFFGAPTAIFVFVHQGLREFAVLDAGVMLQTLMLAAHVRGLGTCAQGALAAWGGPIRAEFDLPERYALICGLSIGYPSEHAVNSFRPERAATSEVLVPPRSRDR